MKKTDNKAKEGLIPLFFTLISKFFSKKREKVEWWLKKLLISVKKGSLTSILEEKSSNPKNKQINNKRVSERAFEGEKKVFW